MTIIAFISQKGGKVAIEIQKQKLKVLLADCDPQQLTSYE